ncbi:conserved hypothetical protein [Candidatus Desulfosporosinus infrequens]|uniref:Uncharacterized protein n=1 Tax=Candidatus Desulfosporosinus infrequens TaxID=2043169 RepID=A0A2U3K034_9FIRM|nr:conserved hypothetical protein [Candidatus Desulfosporosinus infrequens]
MGDSLDEFNLQHCPAAKPFLQRLSLRSVKGISVGFLVSTILGFLLFWQPAYFQLRALHKRKIYWQNILRSEVMNIKTDPKVATIPTMDQLPDLIDQCRSLFVKEGVDVVAFDVERFGERLETGKGGSLDYSLVRLHLRGNWEGIVHSLKALEETQVGNIYLQEVVLDAEGGETLLQIYFRTGEERDIPVLS